MTNKMKDYANAWYREMYGDKNQYASNCGAGKEGAGGFQPGNTCAGDGKGEGKEKPKVSNLDKENRSSLEKFVGYTLADERRTVGIDDLSESDIKLAIDRATDLAQNDGLDQHEIEELRELSIELGYGDTLPEDLVGADVADTGAGEGGMGQEVQKWVEEFKTESKQEGFDLSPEYVMSELQDHEVDGPEGAAGYNAKFIDAVVNELFPDLTSDSPYVDFREDAIFRPDLRPDTGAGEGGGDDFFLSGYDSKEALQSEIESYGSELDQENISISQDEDGGWYAEGKYADTGAGEGVSGEDITQMDEPLMDIMRDRKQELEDSGVTIGADEGGGDVWLPDKHADDDARMITGEGLSFGEKSELEEHLNTLYNYEGDEFGETVPQEHVDAVWDRLQADTGAGDGGGTTGEINRTWGSDSEQRVWIGSEGAYSQGDLVGEWVDATDVVEATEALTKQWEAQGYGDEWAIMDSEGVPDSLHYSPDDIAAYANTIQEAESMGLGDAYKTYAQEVWSGEGYPTAEDVQDAYAGEAGQITRRGSYEIPLGFAEELVDDMGGPSEYLAGQENKFNYIDRDKLVRDLGMDNIYDIQGPDDAPIVVSEDGDEVYQADDFADAEAWIKQSDEDLADELIESGSLSNPDYYFDYEQLAFDLVIGGDISLAGDYVFWNR